MILKLVGDLKWLIYFANKWIAKKLEMSHSIASIVQSMPPSTGKYNLFSLLVEM